MEQGPVERNIIRDCMRRGLPLPDRIQNAPVLAPGLGLYLRAFYDLDSCRPIGMGEGPIPWSAIEQWCQALDLDEEESDDVHTLVRRLDNAYLRHREAKRPKPKGLKK
jgi:hypothetical protein